MKSHFGEGCADMLFCIWIASMTSCANLSDISDDIKKQNRLLKTIIDQRGW